MHPQSQTAKSVRVAQHSCESGTQRRYPAAWNKTATAAANEDNSPQHFRCRCWRIVLTHCVTACDPQNAFLISPPFHKTVSKEAAIAQNQHDFSASDFVVRCALNREQVARPHRRKHACSPCPNLNSHAA